MNMNKLLALVLLSSSMAVAEEAAKVPVCGHVTKGSKNAQLIPLLGKTKIKLENDEIVSCGSMLITHEDAVWVELSDLTQFKIAPNSFVEFGKKGTARHQLYRGEVMVSAPPSIHEFELTTPNSITEYHGGVMLVRYTPNAKETTLASFNRKMVFKNKFHTEAEQVVNAGEMSRLWIGESRIVPSEPEVMNPRTVKVAVQGFEITAEETEEMTAIVERAFESRSKAQLADLEGWDAIEKDVAGKQNRAIASLPEKKKTDTSVDAKEANIGMNLLKKHLFGDEEDQKIFDESRKPASVRGEKFKDTEYQRKKAKESRQVKRVLDEIRSFDPEND